MRQPIIKDMDALQSYNSLHEAKANGAIPWSEEQKMTDTPEWVIYYDKYPVTEGHLLIVPKWNTDQEIHKCLLQACLMGADAVLGNIGITGYNIGINMGESAGQTVMYPHVHLILRRDGDCEDPTGGVRNVIPGKGNYKLWKEEK